MRLSSRALKLGRTPLVLYALLLVLPTVVLGTLLWRQLWLDYQHELADAPNRASAASQRLADAMRDRLAAVLAAENTRPFYHFAPMFTPEGTSSDDVPLYRSPLTRERRPPGVLGWFNFNVFDDPEPRPDVFTGDAEPRDGLYTPERLEAERDVGAITERDRADSFIARAARMGKRNEVETELAVVATYAAGTTAPACLDECARILRGQRLVVTCTDLAPQFLRGQDGRPIVFASRRVFVEDPPEDLPSDSPCLEEIRLGLGTVQGVLFDAEWIFDELPAHTGARLLGPSETLVGRAESASRPDCQAEVELVPALGFDAPGSEDARFAVIRVGYDTGRIRERFQIQFLRFALLASMLAVSLVTGLVWLWRGIAQREEQVRRTENFVAAVTHELRTPLSAIRLHAEMLADGWADDAGLQQEYYRRILAETGRLSALVERVLEKGRISSRSSHVAPMDVNAEVERLRPRLALAGAEDADPAHEREGRDPLDLRFELGTSLPRALLAPESLETILVNLVENARKYAPVDASQPGAEPILVRTRVDDGAVVVEVADRGPGVPAAEAERIFEAFYRVGNESTRTKPGTGLGLHLVLLHARALGGEASVHQREGGGALFRVRFPTAA